MWVHCAAQPTLAALNPQGVGDSEAARWGTALAEICGGALRERVSFDAYTASMGLIDASNGVAIDDEMREAGATYVDSVLATVGSAPLHVEELLTSSAVYEGQRMIIDAWCLQPGILHVWELKGGHRFVDEFENWQLINYVAAALESLHVDGLHDQHLRVVMHVVQPRAFHRRGVDREWSVMASDLRAYINQLRNAADAAQQPKPLATPGDWCGDCNGRVYCEANARRAYDAAERSYDGTPLDITPQSIGVELRFLARAQKALDARVSGLEEQLKAQIRSGANVPFYALEPSTGRTIWTVDTGTLEALAGLYGVELFNAPKPITPKQAIKAGLDADMVKGMSNTPPGETKIVPVDDKNARRVFGN
jgi:hypothetical protein